jgi:hypothetical protein
LGRIEIHLVKVKLVEGLSLTIFSQPPLSALDAPLDARLEAV